MKVKDDLGRMRPFLLDRRLEKFSRLDAYYDRDNSPDNLDDLHKILELTNPKTAKKLIYKHDPLRGEHWLVS